MIRTGRDRPGKKSLFVSLGLHGFVIVLVWATAAFRPEIPVFQIFEIELISPPANIEVQDEIIPEPVTPEETPVETVDPVVEDEPEPIIDDKPEEVVAEPEPATPDDPEPEPEEPEPEPEAPVSPDPDPEEENPGENIEVRMEGLKRLYPEYYENIVRQITRCFRPPSNSRGREASVRFDLGADGRVIRGTLAVLEGSNNIRYDLSAQAAVECASGNNRFGPLPEGFEWETLPVLFNFTAGG